MKIYSILTTVLDWRADSFDISNKQTCSWYITTINPFYSSFVLEFTVWVQVREHEQENNIISGCRKWNKSAENGEPIHFKFYVGYRQDLLKQFDRKNTPVCTGYMFYLSVLIHFYITGIHKLSRNEINLNQSIIQKFWHPFRYIEMKTWKKEKTVTCTFNIRWSWKKKSKQKWF